MEVGLGAFSGRPVRAPRSGVHAGSSVKSAGAVGSPEKKDDVCISPQARAFGAAIDRAEAAMKALSRSDLKALATRTEKNVLSGEWHRDATRLADEKPVDADPSRMDVARRAARFIDRLTAPPRPAGLEKDNPFYGLSRTELAAIQYDESGSFTTNERRAACSEAARQYGEWTAKVCARGMEERALTGKMTNFYREILAYFETLPTIEQVTLPDGYMDRLRAEVAASEKTDMSMWAEYLTLGSPRHSLRGPFE